MFILIPIQMSLIAIRSMILVNVTNDILNITLSSSPGTHQPVNIRLEKFVKAPAARVEPPQKFIVHPHEHRISADWKYNLDVRSRTEAIRKLARGTLSVPRI